MSEGLLVLLLVVGFVLLPVWALVDLARSAPGWSWRESLAAGVIIVGGPLGAALFLVLNRSGAARPGPSRPEPHPMLRHLEDLYAPYDPAVGRDYDPVELVRWVLARLNDEWAGRALTWLEQGAPVAPVTAELRSVADEPRRPQTHRLRALALLVSVSTASES